MSNADVRSSSPSQPSTGHLGDGPVAVRAVDVGLSIDQHAVGQFESRICGSFRSGSPMGQIVAEFEPAMLVGVLKAAPPGWR
jgi:hypothetical protein